MGIYTSRYSNKELADGKYYCVGISIGTPKFKLAYRLENQCYSLAPKGYMLRMNLEDFKKAYYEKLNGIGKDRIINMVMKMERDAAAQGKDLVLLCYEDVRIPEDWCHRTVFAEWWVENTGEIIEELPDPNPPKGKKVATTSKKPEVQTKLLYPLTVSLLLTHPVFLSTRFSLTAKIRQELAVCIGSTHLTSFL